jgi:hypothetical protein
MYCDTGAKPNRVTAEFQHAKLSFEIPRDATLAQLAERLCMLSEIHGGLPLSIDLQVAVNLTQ